MENRVPPGSLPLHSPFSDVPGPGSGSDTRGPTGGIRSWLSCDPGPAISPLKLPDPYLPVRTYLGPPGGEAGHTRQDRRLGDTDHPQPSTTSRLQGRGLATKLDPWNRGEKEAIAPAAPFITSFETECSCQREENGWKEGKTGTPSSPWLSQLHPWPSSTGDAAGMEGWPCPWPSGPPESPCWCQHPPRRMSEHSQAAITANPKPGAQRPPKVSDRDRRKAQSLTCRQHPFSHSSSGDS